jgi:pilus assembly protein CpaB
MAGISMSKRTLALVVAIALAGVATVALVSYQRSLKNKAFEGTETAEAFFAREDIPSGQSGDNVITSNLTEKKVVPRRTIADTAIRSLEEIKGKVASVTILKGEQILAPRFVLPGQARGEGAFVIPTGRQAISVEVDLVPGVAGFIQQGDRISILAQISVPVAVRGVLADRPAVKFLLQDIEVLALGRRVVVTPGAPAQPAQPVDKVLLTIAVTPVEAEKLVFGIFNGRLYLTLLPKGQRPSSTPGRTNQNAFA